MKLLPSAGKPIAGAKRGKQQLVPNAGTEDVQMVPSAGKLAQARSCLILFLLLVSSNKITLTVFNWNTTLYILTNHRVHQSKHIIGFQQSIKRCACLS